MNNRFRDGMGHIDDRLLERYAAVEQVFAKRRRRSLWLRAGALAAVVAIVIVSIPAMRRFKESKPLPTTMLTAQELADIINQQPSTDGPTNAYTTVCVPNADALKISPLPEFPCVPVYRYNDLSKPLSVFSFSAFFERRITNLARAMGVPVPDYEIQKREIGGEMMLYTDAWPEQYVFSGAQSESYQGISVSVRRDVPIFLDGEPVTVDQRQSDDEIIDSLSSIRTKLSWIFGAFFPDAKVVREYDEYSEAGVDYLTVYFYNADAHPLNAYYVRPMSSFIELRFDNHANSSGEQVSDGVLSRVDITYRQNRIKPASQYSVVGYTALISLSEAEERLEQGLVFGGHVCRHCMEAQEAVDFSDYDFVKLTYWSGTPATTYYPFYTFYKEIGIAENGNVIYARTNVPAIPLADIEEYLETVREKYHGYG